MDPIRNPFAPGAGSPPPELAGRDVIVNQAHILFARTKLGRTEKSFIMVGLRGVGKTVLLNRLQMVAESQNYHAIMIEAHEDKSLAAMLVPQLRKVLYIFDRRERVSEQVRRCFRVLRSFIGAIKLKINEIEVGLDVEPEKGSADSGDLEVDLPELLLAVAEAAADCESAIVLMIDEIQYLQPKELSALIMAVHKMSQRQLPLVLIGAGLPQLLALAGDSKSYAERLFDFPEVGPLEEQDAIRAIADPAENEGVIFTDDALREIVRITRGYPYFLQEWGYQAWNLASTSPIDLAIVQEATRTSIIRLDKNFFRVCFDRLTPREKDYLRALAELGAKPQRSGAIAEMMGLTVQGVAPLRNSLIKKGMIYSPEHGDTAFTVPLFDEFMRRTLPEFSKKRKNIT